MVEKVKTGTTCIGLEFNGGVILAADRRMTAGYIAADNTTKIYELNKNIVATKAGHAADSQRLMRAMISELKLIELKNERPARVKEAAMIINSVQFQSRMHGSIISILLGGYDEKEGIQLYNLSPDGTIMPHHGFAVDGSGSVWIKGVFDNEYKKDMSEKEAIALVQKAFLTSFRNDNMSGGGFIIKVITKDGIREVEKKVTKTELVNEAN